MKKLIRSQSNSYAAALAAALAAWFAGQSLFADDLPDEFNHFTFSGRFGLNISAKFIGAPPLSALSNTRRTPSSDPFNYDDGYVYPDSSGSLDGLTWYWGYDDKAAQRVGDTIAMHRSTAAPNIPTTSPALDSDPAFGGEVGYSRRLWHEGRWSFGLGLAGNYLNFNVSENHTYRGNAIQTTDAYPFEPGTEPPPSFSSSGSSYQAKDTDGFLLGTDSTPGRSQLVAGGTAITLNRKLDSDLWGLRLGPVLGIGLSERLRISVSAGLAVGLLDSEVSWSETISVANGVWTSSGSGKGSDSDLLWGGFVSANLSWRRGEHWDLSGGIQYQDLGRYRHSFAGQTVELDLRNSIFLRVGVGYSF